MRPPAARGSRPSCVSHAPSLLLPVSVSPSSRAHQLLDLGPTLTQADLILTKI